MLVKDLFHEFPSIDIHLHLKGTPRLEFDMHETKLSVLEIEIIVLAFTVHLNQ